MSKEKACEGPISGWIESVGVDELTVRVLYVGREAILCRAARSCTDRFYPDESVHVEQLVIAVDVNGDAEFQGNVVPDVSDWNPHQNSTTSA